MKTKKIKLPGLFEIEDKRILIWTIYLRWKIKKKGMIIKIKNIHLADSFEIKDKRMLIWGIYFKRKIREKETMKMENISLGNLLEIKDRKEYAKASNINFQNLVEKNRKGSIGIPICNLGLQEEQSTRLPVSTL